MRYIKVIIRAIMKISNLNWYRMGVGIIAVYATYEVYSCSINDGSAECVWGVVIFAFPLMWVLMLFPPLFKYLSQILPDYLIFTVLIFINWAIVVPFILKQCAKWISKFDRLLERRSRVSGVWLYRLIVILIFIWLVVCLPFGTNSNVAVGIIVTLTMPLGIILILLGLLIDFTSIPREWIISFFCLLVIINWLVLIPFFYRRFRPPLDNETSKVE